MAEKIKFVRPYMGTAKILYNFGEKYRYGCKRMTHSGTGLELPEEEPIVACFDGIVSRIESFDLAGFGRRVWIRSLNGEFEAEYGRLKEIKRSVNESVKAGEPIGLCGHSGAFCLQRKNFLLFGLYREGLPVDPFDFIESETAQKLFMQK